MATPLTGSSVASTYTGLLKTSDNASLTSTLKTVSDGGGTDSALQLSNAAVNTTGDFTVNTSRFSVLSASGNTSIAGTLAVAGASTLTGASTLQSTLAVTGATTLSNTLAVTGATTLSSTLAVSSNISTSGGNLSVYGNIVQSNAAATNTLAGSLSVGTSTTLSSLTCNGLATFNGGVAISTAVTLSNTLTVSGATQINNTLGVSNTITATGTISTSGNLTASGNLTINGNSTLGDAATDLLTIRANTITLPNATTVTVDPATDKFLIQDASDSSRIRVIDASTVIPGASNMPQCVHNHTSSVASYASSNTGSGQEITALNTSITPRSTSSKVLVTVTIRYSTGISSKAGAFILTRDGTPIGTSSAAYLLLGIAPVVYADGNAELINSVTFSFLDSPSSSSSTTYKVHIYDAGIGGLSTTVYLNRANSGSISSAFTSSMTLQEYFA